MKSPKRLKVSNRVFVRTNHKKTSTPSTIRVPMIEPRHPAASDVLKAIKGSSGWTPELVRAFNSFEFSFKGAKVVIPKELWAPVHKAIGSDSKAVTQLKKILKSGDTSALMDFARSTGVDYDVLRKIMSLVNPALHVNEVLCGILIKAVRALKDAGVVAPISITNKQLWKCWTEAIDKDATN